MKKNFFCIFKGKLTFLTNSANPLSVKITIFTWRRERERENKVNIGFIFHCSSKNILFRLIFLRCCLAPENAFPWKLWEPCKKREKEGGKWSVQLIRRFCIRFCCTDWSWQAWILSISDVNETISGWIERMKYMWGRFWIRWHRRSFFLFRILGDTGNIEQPLTNTL